jgi:hypothetical protein
MGLLLSIEEAELPLFDQLARKGLVPAWRESLD